MLRRSQSSINPGFHSELQHIDHGVGRLLFKSQSSINPGFHSEALELRHGDQPPVGVAIQYQSWFSFRVISLGQAEELPNWVSQSSINPGFHSERFYPRPRHGPFGRVAIQYQSWFSFRAKPKVEFETVTRTGRNPVSILVFIPSLFRTAWVLCSNPYCRNPVSILVFIPSWFIDHLHLSKLFKGRNPVSILVFIPS